MNDIAYTTTTIAYQARGASSIKGISITAIKQANISLSSTIMSASSNDLPEWEDLTWAPEQEWTPTESRASSEHSGSSTSTVRFASQIGYADAAVRRTDGRLSYHEWLHLNPDQPHRPQYGLLRLIVMRAWSWLGSIKQKFTDICMWLRG